MTLSIIPIAFIAMSRKGGFYKKYGNKLMKYRIGLQFLVILLLVIASWLFAGK